MGKLPPDPGAPLSKAAVLHAAAAQQSKLLKRVQEMLGLHRLRSDQHLVTLVEHGLATGALEGLRLSGLTDDEIYSQVSSK